MVQSRIDSAQHSLFGDNDDMKIPDPKLPECEPWSKLEQLKNEKETTGIYISGHPLDDYKIEMEHFCNYTLADLKEIEQLKNKEVSVAGIVTNFAEKTSKTGNLYGVFTLEDYNDSIQQSLFSKNYMTFKNYLVKGYFLFIKGKVELRYQSENQYEFRISNIMQLSDVLDTNVKTITIKVAIIDITDNFIEKIFKVIKSSKGICSLKVLFIDPVNNLSVEMASKKFYVNPNRFLKEIIQFPEIKFRIN